MALNAELRALPLFRDWMGSRNVGAHLGDLAVSTLAWGAIVGVPAAGAFFAPRVRLPLVAGLAIAGLVAVWVLAGPLFWLSIARPLPLLLLALLAGFVRSRPTAPADRVRILVLVFALVLLLRMLLNVRLHHFGFVLTVPGMLCTVAFLLCWAPRLLERRRPGAGRRFALAMALVLGVVAAAALTVSHRWHAEKTVSVGEGADRFRTTAVGSYVSTRLASIAANTTPRQTVAVFPENVIVNYLSRRLTPTRFVQFQPSELIAFGEDRMIEAFRRSPPDLVAVIPRDQSEYGVRAFGVDYARRLGAWIASQYVIVDAIPGPRPAQPFGSERSIVILVRRAPAPFVRDD